MLLLIYCLSIIIAEHNAEFNDQTGTIKPSYATLEDRVTGFIYLYILTYILSYLLHGAESFLRSQLVCS